MERVVITDFGLARAIDDAHMTQSGVIAGTPQYMSPEQARGNDVDHRSDLFSLGSVLYFMCTGHPPFRAETTMGVLHRITNDTPRSLRTINSDVPAWLQEIIGRLLEKDPDRRLQSATEVANLLGEWLAHVQQPDVAPRPADVGKQRTSSSGERSRWRITKVALSVTGGLLFLLAAAVIVLEWNKGTLTIECNGRDVAVRIMKGDQVYDRMTVTPSDQSVRLAAGQYVIEIEGKYDGLKVEDDVVTITRGQTQVVRIIPAGPTGDRAAGVTERESASPTSRENARAETPAAVHRRALEQLQGTWIATNKVGAGPLELSDKSARLRLAVANTHFSIELLDAEQNIRTQFRGVLSVSGKTKPWQIQLLFQLGELPQTTLLGEYQIEDDHLTITLTAANNPQDFVGPVPAVWEFVRASEGPGSAGANLNEQGASLESAVREFNQESAALAPDHGQSALTVDELVASIRWALMRGKQDFLPEQTAGFEFVLKEQRLPAAWKIIRNTRSGPEESEMFTSWSIILQSPEGSHTIRQQMLKQPDKYDGAAGAATATADSVPLAAAIRELNDAHQRDPVGKDQPPLTEEEVVAAIRWWKHRRNEAPVTNAEFEAFQQIADARALPPGFTFEVLPNFEPGDGYEYVIWSVRIVMQRTAKPGWTFAFDIRERFVSSSLIDDGTISWGTAAGNGLMAGVQFIPHSGQYARGQKVAVRFFIRNTGDRTLDVSLPNLMTHAYYDQIHVTTPTGEAITLGQDSGLGGPVGWRKLRMGPEMMEWVNGLPLLIGDESLEQDVETVICAEPGQSCCVSFTLPNFADSEGEPLKTGELKFFVTEQEVRTP